MCPLEGLGRETAPTEQSVRKPGPSSTGNQGTAQPAWPLGPIKAMALLCGNRRESREAARSKATHWERHQPRAHSPRLQAQDARR